MVPTAVAHMPVSGIQQHRRTLLIALTTREVPHQAALAVAAAAPAHRPARRRRPNIAPSKSTSDPLCLRTNWSHQMTFKQIQHQPTPPVYSK